MKSRVPRGSPLLDCAFFVDGTAAWYGFASAARCDAAAIAPARHGVEAPPLVYGGLCQRLYALPTEARGDPRVIGLRLD